MTFNFMAGLLEAAGAKPEDVRIEELRGDTFYAVACGLETRPRRLTQGPATSWR